MIDKENDQGKEKNYDYTNADRQRLIRKRKSKAYTIVKALAQRSGLMSDPLDMSGLDEFLARFDIDGEEVDWFEAALLLAEEGDGSS